MKALLKIWLVVLVGAGVGALLVKGSGYVMFAAGDYTVEMSLAMLALLLVVAFSLTYFVVRALIRTSRLRSDVRGWRQRRSVRLAQTALTRGLLEMSEGQWQVAEKRLVRHAEGSDTPLLNYLVAARAAQLQGAHERRDTYIRLAHEQMPSADVAVSLTQAELQLADQQLEQALATLRHLRSVAPKHTYVLRLLRRLYEQLGDWEHLRELIPELRRRKIETPEELRQLERRTYRALLEQASLGKDRSHLPEVWARVPKALRGDPQIVGDYAGYLQERDEDEQAEELLREALKQGWNVALVELYGLLDCPEPGKQLSRLEKYLEKYPEDPILLLTLGRLSMRAQLWGKARGYLEASASHNGPIDAFRELGRLLERMGEEERALQLYRQALTVGDGGRAIPLPQHIGRSQANRPALDRDTVAPPPPHGAVPPIEGHGG